MLTQVPSLRDLPDGHTGFFREHADGGDPAAGHAGPRPGAVRRLHVTELTQLMHRVTAGHPCRNIQVISDAVSEGFQSLICRSTSVSTLFHMRS